MPADSLSSDDFLQSDSEDGSEDGFVELRVGSKASKASRKECGNGNDSSDSSGDFSDGCTQGPCASSSNGRLPDNRKRKNRKTERRQGALDQWQIVEGYAQVTEERINAMLAKTAKSELGGSAQWGPDIWKPTVGFNKLGLRRKIYRCPFRGAANASCQAQLRVTVDTQGQWTLERKMVHHADHSINGRKRGVSKMLAMAATSPSKKDMVPRAAIARVREQHGALNLQEQQALAHHLKYMSKKHFKQSVPQELRGSFGALQLWVQDNTRDALQKAGTFGAHTTFVCGTPQINPDNQTVNLAYSTENLLLNAYRQAQHGIPQLVQVDCTHRLVVDGHACMLFGTVSTAQKFHIIGYAVCDKEDDAAHDHVFRSLKGEVERIVAERSRDQVKI